MTEQITFFTVGYQAFGSLPILTRSLTDRRISVVVDIRRYPYANTYETNPWCEKNLRPALVAAGINYSQLRGVAPSRRLLSDEKYGVPVETCSATITLSLNDN